MPFRRCAKCGKFLKGDGITFDGRYYHRECFVCGYCGSALTGKAVSYKGKPYHPECNPATGERVCAYCRKPFTETYLILGDLFYHRDCYYNHVQKKCCVCGKPFKDVYIYDDWGNVAHPEHDGKPTPFCYTCGRIIAGRPRRLSSEAVLCGECASTAVVTPAQVERSRTAVLSLFKSFGITGVPEHIPIELVKDLMDSHCEGKIRYFPDHSNCSTDFRIMIQEGLPEIHFQGVLAHETLHSWLELYARDLTRPECEGFCNLGGAFVYQKADTKQSNHLLKRMFKLDNEVYGDGYRMMKARYEKLGWAGLLDSLRK